ncbi:MAG TPA: reverse transcriptase family protein [Pirellulales bacterium]|jgi:retron-type reverse transcriptase|nr:reverse transcriptase family protein [Pirellulales bacterium]
MGFLSWLLGRNRNAGRGLDDLAVRLKLTVEQLSAVEPRYREFSIPKRAGGQRRILAPEPELKSLQRRIHRRLLARLPVHPAATGFRRGESIVTHARRHAGQAAVVRLDLKDFFPSTSAKRVEQYFRAIGWNRDAARLLVKLCTVDGGLPQGAPTSPVLSNLLNYRLDACIAAYAKRVHIVYSRYADDITFSYSDDGPAAAEHARALAYFAWRVAAEEGYRLHRKKSSIRRRHQRQTVTGLVVNSRVNLPRETRRWLRAVEHRAAQPPRPLGSLDRPAQPPAKQPTLSPSQLEGWRALASMIELPGR